MKHIQRYLLSIIIGLTLISAQQQFKVGGQIRYRSEQNDKGLTPESKSATFSYLRTRLNLSFSPNESVSGLIQIQDSRTLGEEGSTLSDGSADNMDLHQAYAKIQLAPLWSLKVGRMEVIYGPQRLMGAVGWHNIGRSFDGFVLKFAKDKMTVDIFNFIEHEMDIYMDIYDEDFDDVMVRGAYSSFYVMPGMKTDVFIIQDGERMTYGGYAKGKISGIGYELESAIQKGNSWANQDIKYNGMMWGANFSYTLGGNTVTAGADYISGDDSTTTEIESFHTLYATNHKYYGFMDYFLNLPFHTNGQGLIDMHIKAALVSVGGIRPFLAIHSFKNADQSGEFGQEIDITLKYTLYNAVNIVGGYSMFTNGDIMGVKDHKATWAYLMMVVNF